MRICALRFIGLFAASTAAAQNTPAIQYFSTPLTINPAMTGLIPADIRFAENFNTATGNGLARYSQLCTSLDLSILKGALPAGDALGVGMMYNNSLYSFGRSISATGISAAYHKAIGKNNRHHLSLGAQGMLNSTFYFRRSIGITPWKAASNITLNTGIQYSGILSPKVAVYGGYAFKNVVINEGSPEAQVRLSRPFENIINAGGSIKIGSRLQLFANTSYRFYFVWLENRLSFGSYARILLKTPDEKIKKRNIDLYLGGWISNYNVVSPYVGLQTGNSRFGFSYNYYRPDPDRTRAFELSLIFSGNFHKPATNPQPANWHCPAMF